MADNNTHKITGTMSKVGKRSGMDVNRPPASPDRKKAKTDQPVSDPSQIPDPAQLYLRSYASSYAHTYLETDAKLGVKLDAAAVYFPDLKTFMDIACAARADIYLCKYFVDRASSTYASEVREAYAGLVAAENIVPELKDDIRASTHAIMKFLDDTKPNKKLYDDAVQWLGETKSAMEAILADVPNTEGDEAKADGPGTATTN